MPTDSNRRLRHLVTVLVVIFVFAALKATKPVTMPLAFALFAVILFWPVYRWLNERVASGLALLGTLVALLAVFAVFIGAIWFAVDEVVERAPQYEEEVVQLQTRVETFFGSLPTDGAEARGDGGSESNGFSLSSSRVSSLAQSVASSVWSVLGYLILIVALFALAVVEVPRWKHKLRSRFDDPVSGETLDVAEEVTGQVQRFLIVQSLTSVVTGVLTGLFCWVLGVDFAFVWGLLALVLNFIPTLGSLVAIVPPTLFALFQYGIGWQPPVVLVGLGAIQLILGSYVDPKLQGRYLELSAFVVLVAITFWGWLWGIPGAFIAVPITAALVLASKHITGAEWVARLLTRDEEDVHSLPSEKGA
jgi:predicted PurR-regulated permease PerM